MTSVQENEDNFAEDECTMEFGEEDPPAEASSTGYPVSGVTSGPRFIEYPGEDFSMYLSDPALASPSYDEDGWVCYTAGNRYIHFIVNDSKISDYCKMSVRYSTKTLCVVIKHWLRRQNVAYRLSSLFGALKIANLGTI